MNNSEPGFFKRIFQKKLFRAIALCIILLLTVGILIYFNVFGFRSNVVAGLFGAKTMSEQQLRTAEVTKGDLSVTVTGSGPISSSNRVDVFPGVNTTINKVYFNEGDRVKAGDLMYELDDTDARLNIESIRNNIAQTRISQNTTVSNISKLKVTAPINGYVSDLTAREGDSVGKGSSVLSIIESTEFKLTVPFYSFVTIKKGQEAEVFFPDSLTSTKGKVTYVSDKTTSTSEGSSLRSVEISVTNPGYTLEGLTARAEINSHTSAETGSFSYAESISVKSESGGTIKKVYVSSEQYVTKGTLLMEMSNDDLISSRDTTDLKIQELQSQLDTAEKQLENYKIYAPIEGTIIKQDAATGDAAEKGTLLSTISDPDHMDFSIPIDELDIAKIQVGQKVSISVDALPESSTEPLTGQVSKIAVEGTSTNGVTNYPVTVSINETSKLKAGMNANAQIMINQKADVLMVPLEAIQKVDGKNFVIVIGGQTGSINNSDGNTGGIKRTRESRTNDGSTGNLQIEGNEGNPQGSQNVENQQNPRAARNTRNQGSTGNTVNSVMRPVELGINNDDFAEVLSGLQEGEQVVLPTLATGTGQNNQIRGAGGMGFGAIGGAAPAGGNVQIRTNRN